jgi:hypothetical protein
MWHSTLTYHSGTAWCQVLQIRNTSHYAWTAMHMDRFMHYITRSLINEKTHRKEGRKEMGKIDFKLCVGCLISNNRKCGTLLLLRHESPKDEGKWLIIFLSVTARTIKTGTVERLCLSKVKVKLSLCLTKHHAMKTYWGVEVDLHVFLTLALGGGEWSALLPGRFTLREKSPWYPLDKRLGGPQSHPGRGGEEKNSNPPPGIEP